MKCLFWNLRGLANSPTRLALKSLILSNNPDIILIAEPWMNFECFPKFWLQNLGLKLFAVNSRVNLLPNLWCICKLNICSTIIAADVQHVSFCEDKLLD
jgi:hypothetical protein